MSLNGVLKMDTRGGPPPLRKLNEFKIEQKNYFDGVLGTIETILDIVLTLFWPA